MLREVGVFFIEIASFRTKVGVPGGAKALLFPANAISAIADVTFILEYLILSLLVRAILMCVQLNSSFLQPAGSPFVPQAHR